MVGGVASPKAGNGYIHRVDGTIDEPWVVADKAITRSPTGEQWESCWNYDASNESSSLPAGCENDYRAVIKAGMFNCGRMELSLMWGHYDMQGPGWESSIGLARTPHDAYNVVINYGRDCTGAPGEKWAGNTGPDSGYVDGGGDPSAVDCEAIVDEQERGKCEELKSWCTNPWVHRKVRKAAACNANFSYNSKTRAQWEQYLLDTDAKREEFCPAWASGEMSTAEAHQIGSSFFDDPDEEWSDGGITCVCDDPQCDSFWYMWCTTYNDGAACGSEACTNAGFEDADGDGVCEKVCTNEEFYTWPFPKDKICEKGVGSPTPTPTTVVIIGTPTPTATETPTPSTVIVVVGTTPPGYTIPPPGYTLAPGETLPPGVTIVPGSGAGTAGGVATGPGEATMLALVLASLTALLYVSYTHTNLFKRREAGELGEGQEPMDFQQ
jgi:hypothetical protein